MCSIPAAAVVTRSVIVQAQECSTLGLAALMAQEGQGLGLAQDLVLEPQVLQALAPSWEVMAPPPAQELAQELAAVSAATHTAPAPERALGEHLYSPIYLIQHQFHQPPPEKIPGHRPSSFLTASRFASPLTSCLVSQ